LLRFYQQIHGFPPLFIRITADRLNTSRFLIINQKKRPPGVTPAAFILHYKKLQTSLGKIKQRIIKREAFVVFIDIINHS